MPHTNKLINETSPYLLQHAHNPVNWYPWGEEALQKAKTENKPILLSIGYAACHWCHVMERESFENEATAEIMNEHFVNIKLDREERPDLDHIYMDAVQAMTGSGGWPLNVFLTPDTKPFYGGTYFPPQRAFNRPSWIETLQAVITAFTERRHEMDAQAENLTAHILQSNAFGSINTNEAELFNKDTTYVLFQNIMKSADKEWGGFGKAPKFPQTFSIQYLLRYHFLSGNKEALEQAVLSLDKMIEGGIYDQLGGGFARYSTDTEWLAPHFEKMLYDNALLLSILSEAFQLTRKDRYKEVIEETMAFVQRELMNEEKGFYSALDADSEGVEGKFYVWQTGEVKELLGNDADLFCEFYDVSEAGNFSEGGKRSSILRIKKPVEDFAKEKNSDPALIKKILEEGRKKLFARREKRIRPQLDDKIILGWNALMNTACSKAFAATGNDEYRQLAIGNMHFILKQFMKPGTVEFFHTWKNNLAKYPAFLDDYAFLVEALLHLQEITGDTGWLEKANAIARFVKANFSETGTDFFFYTPVFQQDVIVRKKEIYDGAVPSGNSVMAYNIHQLGILLDDPEMRKRSANMVLSLGKIISKYPTSFGNWGCLLQELITGTYEIAIVGKNISSIHYEVLANYIPQKVLMTNSGSAPDYPLLTGKNVGEAPASIFLCSNYTCSSPVFSAKELILLIDRVKKV